MLYVKARSDTKYLLSIHTQLKLITYKICTNTANKRALMSDENHTFATIVCQLLKISRDTI